MTTAPVNLKDTKRPSIFKTILQKLEISNNKLAKLHYEDSNYELFKPFQNPFNMNKYIYRNLELLCISRMEFRTKNLWE